MHLCRLLRRGLAVRRYCEIRLLPESVGELVALQTLGLRNNALAALPASVGRLRALQSLSLGRNALEALPDSFCDLGARPNVS